MQSFGVPHRNLQRDGVLLNVFLVQIGLVGTDVVKVFRILQPVRLSARAIASEGKMLGVLAIRGVVVVAEQRETLSLFREALPDAGARVAGWTLRDVCNIYVDFL